MKISPVDPEIIGLQGIIKKVEHINSSASMPSGLNNYGDDTNHLNISCHYGACQKIVKGKILKIKFNDCVSDFVILIASFKIV